MQSLRKFCLRHFLREVLNLQIFIFQADFTKTILSSKFLAYLLLTFNKQNKKFSYIQTTKSFLPTILRLLKIREPEIKTLL